LGKQRKALARPHKRLFEETDVKAGEKQLQRLFKAALRQP